MKATRSGIFAARKQLLMSAALVLASGFAMPSMAGNNDDDVVECNARTLRGVYMFRASGYNINTVSGAALPKAIIETIVFDGQGNVSTPAVSVSVNGFIIQPPQGSPGVYTVDADCTGTLTFADGTRFDLQINPRDASINLLQVNPNTVMQGRADKALPLSAWRG
jgi:hypothetical protein